MGPAEKALQLEFLKRIKALSALCNFPLTKDIVELYDRALRPLGYEKLIVACDEILNFRKGHDRFPSIADIRNRIEPDLDIEGTAIEVASKIIEGISKYGYSNTKDAEQGLGSIAWYVVGGSDGWVKLCQTMLEREIPAYRAQFRQRAAHAIRAYKAGRLGQAPMLDDFKKKQIGSSEGLESIGNLVRSTHNGNKERPDGGRDD